MKDDPQGEGGAFWVGFGATLVLSDCILKNNYCGKKVSIYVYFFFCASFTFGFDHIPH